MSCICRTCLSEISNNPFVDINRSEFARKQLTLCIPELNLDLVLEPVLCLKCVEALNTAYDFKSCCLQSEQRIQAHMQTLAIEQPNIELDAVLRTNYSGINSIVTCCDTSNDLNNIHDHDQAEYSVTSENFYEMSFDDGEEVNYNSFAEEKIKIEEHELDSYFKSEMLDTGLDAEISCSLRQWSEFENRVNVELQDCSRSTQKQDFDLNDQLESIKSELDTESNVAAMQPEYNEASAVVNDTAPDHISLPEPSNSDDFEEHNESSRRNSANSSGLLRQYNKLDSMNCNANVENCNSSTISAESFTQQGNCVTKIQVGVVSMEPNNSSSTGVLLRQRKVNVAKIAAISNIHFIKRRSKNISSIKSHSRINKHCKGANRSVLYSCHQKERNIEEQIVAQAELHSELLRDCRVVLTRIDVDNYAVMNGVETQVKKSSHLKCDMNIKSNNSAAAATEAEADLLSVRDCSPLNLKHSNTSALNSSNTFTNVSLQHFINSNNLSVFDYGSSQKINLESHLKTHTGEKPYKCDHCKYASVTKRNLIIHMRNHTGQKPYKCDHCKHACSSKGNLVKHIKTHKGEKPYKCNVCDYGCSAKNNLTVHMRRHTGEKPYKCNVCGYGSSQKINLENHLKTHTGEKPYKCNVCDYGSSQKINLENHLKTHTGEKPYKCDQCDYASVAKRDLMIHMRKHTGEKPYKCNVCDYGCSAKNNLTVHMRRHTGEKPYKCNVCDYGSSQKINLENHLKTHTGEKPYKCDQCDYASVAKRDLMIHMRKHTGEKPYKCEQCDNAFSCNGKLIIHMRNHRGEKPYKCNVCNYASFHKGHLNNHLRTHTGDKPYKCDQCGYACSIKGSLKIHMGKHSGEKPYKCEQCDYACFQRPRLIIHMRKHTGEKPYKCKHCDYASSRKDILIIHMRKHTGEKPYKCEQCDYAFSRRTHLIIHMRKHTGENPYKCEQCGYACSSKGNLLIHMRNHTGEKPYKYDG